MIRITSLCDNVNDSKKLWSVEGNSILVEIDGKKFLFDTGRNGVILEHNLAILGVTSEEIDGVVLTHGHMGHIGAMRDGISFPNAMFYYGKGIERPKVKWSPEKTKAVRNEDLVASVKQSCPWIEVDDLHELVPGKAYLFKSRLLSDALPPSDLLRMKIFAGEKLERDLFEEELNLCIRHPKGLILLTGCAHRGVYNIVSTAQSIFPGEQIYAMIGGTHAFDNAAVVDSYILQMKELAVSLVAPSHCTGVIGRASIAKAMPKEYVPFGTGAQLEFSEE